MIVDTTLPLCMHPNQAARWRDHADVMVRSIGEDFADVAAAQYERLASLDDLVAPINANRDLSAEAKARKASEVRTQVRGEARQALERVLARIDSQTKREEAAAWKAIEPERRVASQELRAFVRALPRDQRVSFLLREAKGGNKELAFAVLNAESQRFLSGLDEIPAAEWESLRTTVLSTLAPEQHSRIEALQRLRREVAGSIEGLDGPAPTRSLTERYTAGAFEGDDDSNAH